MKSTMLFAEKKSFVEPRVPRCFAAVCLCLFALFFSSCSRYEGYGVVNWSAPEMGLSAGDVVPVCIRSNISDIYVIEIETAGGTERREIPLWQLSFFSSRAKARQAAAGMEEFRHLYASVKLDGLPVREEPDNTARQVYRLRQAETIKITGTGEGAPVIAGNAPLEGDWYTVMTADGTRGWCFSYNLTLFDERDDPAARDAGGESLAQDGNLSYILSRAWYPTEYKSMLESESVDISRVNPAWGFFPGADSQIARIEDADGVVSFPYTDVTRDSSGTYRFVGSSLFVELRRGGVVSVQYTDDDGMPVVRYFTALDVSPAQMIADERTRRAARFAGILEAGPGFASDSYGVLRFTRDGSFLWSGYGILVPSVIPSGAGGRGRAETECFLSPQLAQAYDGVLSLYFENASERINFLYAFADGGLRLEPVSRENVTENTVVSRDISPVVMFFSPELSGNSN